MVPGDVGSHLSDNQVAAWYGPKKTTEFVFCNLHRNQPDLSSYANYLTGNAFRCHNRTHHLKEVCYIIAYIDIVVTAKTGVMKFLPSFRLLDHLTSLEKAF